MWCDWKSGAACPACFQCAWSNSALFSFAKQINAFVCASHSALPSFSPCWTFRTAWLLSQNWSLKRNGTPQERGCSLSHVDVSPQKRLTNNCCSRILRAALILCLIDCRFLFQSDELPSSVEITSFCTEMIQSHFPFTAATALRVVILVLQNQWSTVKVCNDLYPWLEIVGSTGVRENKEISVWNIAISFVSVKTTTNPVPGQLRGAQSWAQWCLEASLPCREAEVRELRINGMTGLDSPTFLCSEFLLKLFLIKASVNIMSTLTYLWIIFKVWSSKKHLFSYDMYMEL